MRILHCIFNQILLYISDFSIDLSKFSIKILDEALFKQFIVAFLRTLKCPLLVDFPKDGTQAANLEDSRDLLVILAWVIQISGLFDRYHESLLERIHKDLEFNDDFIDRDDIYDIDLSENTSKMLKSNGKIEENDVIEGFTKLKKKFNRLFDLFQYQEKTREKLQMEMSFQKLNFKLNELFMLKNEKKFRNILEKIMNITSALEKEKDNLKHEELFWLWMESVVDLDKKELINDPDYGFSEIKDIPLNALINDKGSLGKGIEGLFEELKALNEKYQEQKEKFKVFQVLWEKRKNQLKEKNNSLEQLKADSGKLLNEFEKKFLSFEKMQGMLQKNAPEIILTGEIMSLFPKVEVQGEKINNEDEEKELDSTLKKLNEEEANLAEIIREKMKNLMNVLKENFVIYP